MNGPKVIRRRPVAKPVAKQRPQPKSADKRVRVPRPKSRNIVDFAYLISNLKRIQHQLNYAPKLDGAATRSLIDFATEILDSEANEGREVRASLIEDAQVECDQKEGTNVISLDEYRKRRHG